MTRTWKRVCAICCGLAVSGSARAADLYVEGYADSFTFTDPNAGGAFASVNWRVLNHAGTDYSASTANPIRLVRDIGAPDGDNYRSYTGSGTQDEFVFIADVPVIHARQRDALLQISFMHRDFVVFDWHWYRVLLQVDNRWYASQRRTSTAGTNWTTETFGVADPIWIAWETDIADGFAEDVVSSGLDDPGHPVAAANVPGGDITGVALLQHNGDRGGAGTADLFRFDAFRITGTHSRQGSWYFVDDFQDSESDRTVSGQHALIGTEWFGRATNTALCFKVAEENRNRFLRVSGDTTAQRGVALPLGDAAIVDNTKGTVFFRVRPRNTVGNLLLHIACCEEQPVVRNALGDVTSWPAQTTRLCALQGAGGDVDFRCRNGNVGETGLTPVDALGATFYSLWFDIDLTQGAEHYDVYIRGGAEFPLRTLLHENLGVREYGNGGINYFLMMLQVEDNGAVDMQDVDDIFVDPAGFNSTDPVQVRGTLFVVR